MKPFLMGSETEYAVMGKRGDTVIWPRDVHTMLYKAVQQERHWLADVVGGEALYLENGARFYLDYGCHPEYATPECFNPTQVVAYDKAGERLLLLAKRRVEQERRGTTITITKNNISVLHPDAVTWGNHESYTSWVDARRSSRALMAHMVSRTIYAGSGCLSGYAGANGFELSQRARHITSATGNDTTGDRALFCTRVRKVSDMSATQGWSRAHLISKDSQRAPLGIYLTYGVTGLLFLLLNEGHEVGLGLDIEEPVQALRAVSSDPWLRRRVRLTDGRELTALELQWIYFEEAETLLGLGSFPEWTADVMRHWSRTLLALGRDPLSMARQLDPYCKLLIFNHELRRAGTTWGELSGALRSLAFLNQSFVSEVVAAVVERDPSRLDDEQKEQYESALAQLDLNDDGNRERLRLALRLQQLDVMYHEVGGMYDRMAESGQVEGVVLGPEEIDRATREAPPGGRAAMRGEMIRNMRDPGWLCEWRYLFHSDTGEFVDMRNPFAGEFKPSNWSRLLVDQPTDADVQEIVGQIGRR